MLPVYFVTPAEALHIRLRRCDEEGPASQKKRTPIQTPSPTDVSAQVAACRDATSRALS